MCSSFNIFAYGMHMHIKLWIHLEIG